MSTSFIPFLDDLEQIKLILEIFKIERLSYENFNTLLSNFYDRQKKIEN